MTRREPWRAKQRSKMTARNATSADKKQNTHLSHLSAAKKERYGNKLEVLGTCDPYTAPDSVFEQLHSARSLPKLEFGDVYIYLVENPSPYTAARMKAYKSTDSYRYFMSGWVNNAAVWEVKDKSFFILRAKVSTNLANNSHPIHCHF